MLFCNDAAHQFQVCPKCVDFWNQLKKYFIHGLFQIWETCCLQMVILLDTLTKLRTILSSGSKWPIWLAVGEVSVSRLPSGSPNVWLAWNIGKVFLRKMLKQLDLLHTCTSSWRMWAFWAECLANGHFDLKSNCTNHNVTYKNRCLLKCKKCWNFVGSYQ